MKLWLAIQSRIKSGWQAFFVPESLFPQIVIQIDGLGRAVRTAKTGCVNGEAGWNASGAVEYDCKGRTVKEGMTGKNCCPTRRTPPVRNTWRERALGIEHVLKAAL